MKKLYARQTVFMANNKYAFNNLQLRMLTSIGARMLGPRLWVILSPHSFCKCTLLEVQSVERVYNSSSDFLIDI